MGVDYFRKLLALWHLILLLLAEVIRVSCDAPIANTDKGRVKGYSVMANNKKVDVFTGIPYAVPPTGNLRYKPPQDNDPWPGILDATKLPYSCVQPSDTFFGNFSGSTMWNANTFMSEDCLYLNVWVPRTNPPYKDKAVIVWIYGGGFYSGTSTLNIYQAQYLAAENDVVVVSMQYRVASFGFLALDTKEAPGNAGLWDQRMALDWVNRNIHYFSGNAQNITLMGESAGAASVGMFLLCDLCTGLFQRAILQSGSPAANWAILPKKVIWQRSESFAQKMNCSENGNHDRIVDCLRTKTNYTDLLFRDRVVDGYMQLSFVPIIDGVFITQDPRERLRSGSFKKVPILVGSNRNEATFFLIYEDDLLSQRTDQPNVTSTRFDDLFTNRIFHFYPFHPHQLSQVGREAIIFRYKDWINPEDPIALRTTLDKAASDFFFVCPVNYLARSYADQKIPVYYYWFSHRWSANPWPEWTGVLHADEIWFTFGHPHNMSYLFTEEERALSSRMMTYWANFAKTGNPNQAPGELPVHDWPVFKSDQQLYLNISVEAFATGNTIGQGPRAQDCAFWDIYLPKLLTQTSALSDVESEWKVQFHEWKTRYIVDWKTQFDSFLNSYQRRMGLCSGGRP